MVAIDCSCSLTSPSALFMRTWQMSPSSYPVSTVMIPAWKDISNKQLESIIRPGGCSQGFSAAITGRVVTEQCASKIFRTMRHRVSECHVICINEEVGMRHWRGGLDLGCVPHCTMLACRQYRGKALGRHRILGLQAHTHSVVGSRRGWVIYQGRPRKRQENLNAIRRRIRHGQ